MNRTYSELITIPTFIDRLKYLKLDGQIGKETYGYDRYLNQTFYRSKEWRQFRHEIIVRDNGCDLGMNDEYYSIRGLILIHHINPISVDDILDRNQLLFDPENVICVSKETHNAIHYGSEELISNLYSIGPIRFENDTSPWRI